MNDIYKDYTVDELEDALKEARFDLEDAERRVRDIEGWLDEKRDKPIRQAKAKLAKWSKAVTG